MRSLVNMLNSALLSLERTNISICLVTILGYNTRGYTDIETEDEDEIYHKDFYLKSDCGMAVTDDAFAFLQIKGKFNMCDLSYISSLTKSASEVKLGEIKARTVEYISILKPLLDFGFLETHIKSLGKGNLEDFVEQLNNWLMKVNFQGDLIDIQWSVEYDRMCQNVCNSTNENRENFVADLISAIGENINKTVNYIESI